MAPNVVSGACAERPHSIAMKEKNDTVELSTPTQTSEMFRTETSRGGLTEGLVGILNRPIGAADRERAALHVLDWIGCAVAGATTPPGRAMISASPSMPGACANWLLWLPGDLLPAQGDHRIDLRCPPRRNVARQECHSRE